MDERTYWQNLSGLSATASLADCKMSYLQAQHGGVTDSIQSLFWLVYGKNELGYWRDIAGNQTLSLQDARSTALAAAGATGYGVGGYGVTGYGV